MPALRTSWRSLLLEAVALTFLPFAAAWPAPAALDACAEDDPVTTAAAEGDVDQSVDPLVFDDSFESGDTCVWDASFPDQGCPPPCNGQRSDCDASPGCEVDHTAGNGGSCGSATDVGTFDGDLLCGFGCPSNSTFDNFATRNGRSSAWFKARVREDSDCPASIQHRVLLDVPTGADYDLYVWRNCVAPSASSTNGGSTDETVTFSQGDDTGSEDSFDYWVEVRYFNGASCTNWTLTFQGHNC